MKANDPNPEPAPPAAPGLPVDDLLVREMPALLVFLRHHTGEALAARETVDDLAQSVCREVLLERQRVHFETPASFRAWLFLQATRKVVDRARFHRMQRRDSRREQALDETRSSAEQHIYSSLVTGSQIVCAQETAAKIERLLQGLPEAQREAVLLSRVAGLTYEDIARQKGVAESTIRGLASRGLARLIVELERN